jgi:hypothetical protein
VLRRYFGATPAAGEGGRHAIVSGRRMDKRWVLICLVCCLAVEAAACSRTPTSAPSPARVPTTVGPGSARIPSVTTETGVVTSYYRSIVAQNYQLAFTFLDANAVGPDGLRMTWQAFLQLAQSMDGDEGPVTDFSMNASGSMIVMTNYRKRMGPYHAHLQLKRAGNGWKIVSMDRI